MRFEFALAVVLAAIPLVTLAPARTRRWYLGGFRGTVGLYVLHLLVVGHERVGRLVGDLIATRPGRSRPLPTDFGDWITNSSRSRSSRRWLMPWPARIYGDATGELSMRGCSSP